METLAYTHLQVACEEASLDPHAYEMQLFKGFNWKQLPNSTWLSLLGIAVLWSSLSVMLPASALRVNTPSGRCLHARYGPGTQYGIYTCVRDGAVLKPAVARQGNWVQLSSGRWVYGPYTTATTGGSSGGGGGGASYGYTGRAIVRTNGSSLHVRSTPGGAIVGNLPNGMRIDLSGRVSGGWSQLTSGYWVATRWISRIDGGNGSVPGQTLRPGNSGQAVTNLQNRLRTTGFYNGPVTGYYGRLTETAVRDFESSRGLPIDGIADSQTLAALYGTGTSGGSGGGAPLGTLQVGSRGQSVTNLQNRLRALGFYRGPITGYYGSLTESAVRDFEASRGLPIDGIADSQTLAALY